MNDEERVASPDGPSTPRSEILKLLEGLDMTMPPTKGEQKTKATQANPYTNDQEQFRSDPPKTPAVASVSKEAPANVLTFSPILTVHEELPKMSRAYQAVDITHKEAAARVPQKENKLPTDERPGFTKTIREMQAKARNEAISPQFAEIQQTKSIPSPDSVTCVLVKLPKTREGPPVDTAVKDFKEMRSPSNQAQTAQTESQSDYDARMKVFLAKGAKKLERLHSQDPRVKTLTPAQAWGKGLIGETLTQSLLTTSEFLEEQEEDSQHQRDRQRYLEAQHAANLQAEEDRAAAVAQTFMTLEDDEVAKATVAAAAAAAQKEEDSPKQPFKPSEETLKFWTDEPRITLEDTPQQLTCNLCFSQRQKFYHSFEALQLHKANRHKNYCVQCDIDFYGEDEYIAHKLSSEEHVICKICHIDFEVKDGLVEHTKLSK